MIGAVSAERFDADVVVVGSGFGGSVAALRWAQAGRRVVVLEQGRRLTTDDLAAGARSPRRLLWEPAAGLRGYFRQTLLRHVMVVSGVGVGGGSLVYAAVLLEPEPEAFAAPGWTSTGIDWRTELAPSYATAAAMLGRETNPHRSAQDHWLEQAARSLGVQDSYSATPQGIAFADCVRCGSCLTGCVHGAKNSVDRTYLAQAEALGARIEPRARARVLVPLPGGGWRVVVDDPLAPARQRTARSITAAEVVVAAGVLGTTELLLASRDRFGTLPDLSPRLGEAVRTNSEAFVAVLQPDDAVDVTDGATISSHFHPDARTHVTNNRFPESYGFMRWYLAPLVDADDQASRRRATLRELATHPWRATANARARDWHKRVTVLTVMQHADNALRLEYRRDLRGWRLRSTLPPGGEPAPVFLPEADAAGRAVAAASGGTAYGTLLESVLGTSATAHVLGGAALAASPELGVVDTDHRVFGYEGLYVMDGSVVPANVGVNPSLTITALAERAAARALA